MNQKIVDFVQTFTRCDVALTQEMMKTIQSSSDGLLLQADSKECGPERIDDVICRLKPLLESYSKDDRECLWLYEISSRHELRMDEYNNLVKALEPWSNCPWVMKSTEDIHSIRISVLYYRNETNRNEANRNEANRNEANRNETNRNEHVR